MTDFKKEILTRFIGTDEGEVTEYLGCELVRNCSAKTAKLVQRGYVERVLRTFGMWDCKPCTPRMITTGSQRKIALRLWTQSFFVDIVVSVEQKTAWQSLWSQCWWSRTSLKSRLFTWCFVIKNLCSLCSVYSSVQMCLSLVDSPSISLGDQTRVWGCVLNGKRFLFWFRVNL